MDVVEKVHGSVGWFPFVTFVFNGTLYFVFLLLMKWSLGLNDLWRMKNHTYFWTVEILKVLKSELARASNLLSEVKFFDHLGEIRLIDTGIEGLRIF